MALAKAKQEATDARLADLSVQSGADWVQTARQSAFNRLKSIGLPSRRDEYWRYNDPARFNDVAAKPVPITARETGGFESIDRLKVVFVDGVFDADASDDLTQENVTIERLEAISKADIHWVKDLYGVLENNGQSPVERPFATLNTAFASDGLIIHATGKVSKPISIIYRRNSEAKDVVLHHVIRVDEDASICVLENGSVGARSNVVTEVSLADRAGFNHIRTQGLDADGCANSHIFGRLGAECSFKSFTLSAQGAVTRNEIVLELTGDNAIAHVAGAALGDGKFLHDDTVFITHDAVNCESRQVFKKVLRNGATGVFQGKILVNQIAQKTDGYQISQSLLLDDDAQFLAKP